MTTALDGLVRKDMTMKVNVSEETARKALALIPGDVRDLDLLQLRDRLEKGLKAVTAAGTLNPDELDALVTLVICEFNSPKHWLTADQSARPHLRTALPKLQALRDRRLAEGGA